MGSSRLCEYLRDLRMKNRFSLRALAAKAGISGSYLSQIETGERRATAEMLRRLAPVYGVPVRDLLEVAGILDGEEPEASDDDRVEWAFRCLLSDPVYRFGNRWRGDEFPPVAKRFAVEVYQATTGRKLL